MGSSKTKAVSPKSPILLQHRGVEAQFYFSREGEGTVERILQLRAATPTLLVVYRKECGCPLVTVLSSYDELVGSMVGSEQDLREMFVQVPSEVVRRFSVVAVDAGGQFSGTLIDEIFTLEGAALVLDAMRDAVSDHASLRVRDNRTGELWTIGPRAPAIVLAGSCAPNFFGLTIHDEAGNLVEPFGPRESHTGDHECTGNN